MKNNLDKIIDYGLIGLICLVPLFFLPITANVFFINKLGLLLCGCLVLTVICLVNSFLKKEFTISFSIFDLPVLLLAVAFVVSTFLRSPNRTGAFWGETGTILAVTLLYFLLSHRFRYGRKKILPVITTSGSILALTAIYQYMGVGQAFLQGTIFESQSFSPAGTLLSLSIFLLGSLMVSLKQAFDQEQTLYKTLLFVVSGLQMAGLVLAVYQLMPGQPTSLRLLPFSAGWQIAIDTFKDSPFFGVGPNNFLSAFTRNKPLSLNYTDLWQRRFLRSSNWPFHLLTTTGILGLAGWIALFLVYVKNYKRTARGKYGKTFTWLTGLMFLASLLAPISIISIMMLYVGLALMAAPKTKTKTINLKNLLAFNQSLVWLFLGLTVVLGAVLIYPLYPFAKVWASEYYFRQSIKAAQANDGIRTYNLQLKALRYNPRNLDLRISLAQTNLALAQNLSSKENPADQDRQNIIQLVQQSINEAKKAVSTNPQNITAWENLATVYRNLINFAQKADQLAISALTQAVKLDPTNPDLRVQLGGLYYSLQDYDRAQRVFEQATSAKANYANAYYNLGVVLQDQDKLQKAALAYRQTLNLLPPESEDRQAVLDRLKPIEEQVKKQQQEAQKLQAEQQAQISQSQTGNITEPEPLPKQPSGFEPILLEEEDTASPEATPTPTPEIEEGQQEAEPTPTPELEVEETE